MKQALGLDVTAKFYSDHSNNKIVCCDVHPYLSWVVTAGQKNGVVTIWDYQTSKIINELSLQSFEEEKREGLPAGTKTSNEEKKMGLIRVVKFYDILTIKHKLLLESVEDKQNSKMSFETTSKTAQTAPSLVIILTENRVYLYDYFTLQVSELKLSSFDNRPQYSVEFLSCGSSLLFGGDDGKIRIWDCEKREVIDKLQGGHVKAVIKLFSLKVFIATSSIQYLLSAGFDGNLCLWNVATLELYSTNKKMIPTNEFISFSFNTLESLIVIEGTDKTILFWNLVSNKEVRRVKIKLNKSLGCIEPFSHSSAPPSTTLVTFKESDYSSKIFLVEADSSTRELIDICEFIESKTTPKIQSVSTHPFFPHIIICTTNLGLLVLNLGQHNVPSFAVTQHGLESKLYSIVDKQLRFEDFDNPMNSRRRPVKRETIRDIDTTRPASSILLSGSERYITLHWQDKGTYQIIDLQNPTKIAEEGVAKSFAWSSTRDRYAIVETLAQQKDRDRERDKSIKRNNNKSKLTLTSTQLKIRDMDNDKVTIVKTPSSPAQLFGGPLLGVSLYDLADTIDSFRFYDWNKLTDFGISMPPPILISWDPAGDYCLLSYSTHSFIFQTRGTFKHHRTLNFNVLSCLWVKGSMLYSTSTEIGCLFLKYKHEPFVIASNSPFNLHNYLDLRGEKAIPSYCQRRPIGSISLVILQDETLTILNSNLRLITLILSHPILKCFMLASASSVDSALSWIPTLPSHMYQEMAHIFSENGYSKEALQIPGLSRFQKLKISSKSKNYETACEILSEIIDQVNGKPTKERPPTKQHGHASSHSTKNNNTGPGAGTGHTLAANTATITASTPRPDSPTPTPKSKFAPVSKYTIKPSTSAPFLSPSSQKAPTPRPPSPSPPPPSVLSLTRPGSLPLINLDISDTIRVPCTVYPPREVMVSVEDRERRSCRQESVCCSALQ
eukprot:TRINITY_DN5833_c0_g1_i2.p1 TRINITY_DN5833_c0_g1~~TRINITY_DN5833_c0_g1_i2.p1  ORF type:complete len:950 (-),score=149.30 TRINITY_DN5833_c0_g1_i2:474-3323(-)